MISIKAAKAYCNEDISKIENYDKAINDKTQKWHCHHRLEVTKSFICSKEILKELDMYYHRPSSELIFLTVKEHRKIHSSTYHFSERMRKMSKDNWKKIDFRNKVLNARKGKTRSEFGRKFKEHFGITQYQDKTLYHREYLWYWKHNNNCSWEK